MNREARADPSGPGADQSGPKDPFIVMSSCTNISKPKKKKIAKENSNTTEFRIPSGEIEGQKGEGQKGEGRKGEGQKGSRFPNKSANLSSRHARRK